MRTPRNTAPPPTRVGAGGGTKAGRGEARRGGTKAKAGGRDGGDETAIVLTATEGYVRADGADARYASGLPSTHPWHARTYGVHDGELSWEAVSHRVADGSEIRNFWARADREGIWGGDVLAVPASRWADRAGTSTSAPTPRATLAVLPPQEHYAYSAPAGGTFAALQNLPLFLWCSAGGAVAGAVTAVLQSGALARLGELLGAPRSTFLRAPNGMATSTAPLYRRRMRGRSGVASGEMVGVLATGTRERRRLRTNGHSVWNAEWPEWFGKPPADFTARPRAARAREPGVPTVANARSAELREEYSFLRRAVPGAAAPSPSVPVAGGPWFPREAAAVEEEMAPANEEEHGEGTSEVDEIGDAAEWRRRAQELSRQLEKERERSATYEANRREMNTKVMKLAKLGIKFKNDLETREEMIRLLNQRVEEAEHSVEALATVVTLPDGEAEHGRALSLPPVEQLASGASGGAPRAPAWAHNLLPFAAGGGRPSAASRFTP